MLRLHDIFSIFLNLITFIKKIIFTLKRNKYTLDIVLALVKLANTPSITLMVESRLWSYRNPGWKNISLEVKILWKNEVSTLKNYSGVNYHLSCKDNFRVESDSKARNLYTELQQVSNFFSTL